MTEWEHVSLKMREFADEKVFKTGISDFYIIIYNVSQEDIKSGIW